MANIIIKLFLILFTLSFTFLLIISMVYFFTGEDFTGVLEQMNILIWSELKTEPLFLDITQMTVTSFVTGTLSGILGYFIGSQINKNKS